MPRRVRPWPGISEEAETLAYAMRGGVVSLEDVFLLAQRQRWVVSAFEELLDAGVIEIDVEGLFL